MKCQTVYEEKCPKGHTYHWVCHKGAPKICPLCNKEAIEEQKRKARGHQLEQKRLAIQREHAIQLAVLDERIKQQQELAKDIADKRDREYALAQRKLDLDNATATTEQARKDGHNPDSLPVGSHRSSVTMSAVPLEQGIHHKDSRTNRNSQSQKIENSEKALKNSRKRIPGHQKYRSTRSLPTQVL
jgi:hypothetical protein